MLIRHDDFRKLRTKLEDEIERLIAMLNDFDGDSDEETFDCDLELDDEDTSAEDDPEGFDPESDHGGEELGELDEAKHGLCVEYGLDQTKPVTELDFVYDRVRPVYRQRNSNALKLAEFLGKQ